MKKLVIIVTTLLATILVIMFFIHMNEPIVTDNGVIAAISTTQKTLKIDIGEREYKIPDVFICNEFTEYFIMNNSENTSKMRFEDLVVGQSIVIKYNIRNDKVYKIIVKYDDK